MTAAAPEDLRDLREKSDINSFIKAIKRQPPVNCNRKLYCSAIKITLVKVRNTCNNGWNTQKAILIENKTAHNVLQDKTQTSKAKQRKLITVFAL